jgi:O-antigen ligase
MNRAGLRWVGDGSVAIRSRGQVAGPAATAALALAVVAGTGAGLTGGAVLLLPLAALCALALMRPRFGLALLVAGWLTAGLQEHILGPDSLAALWRDAILLGLTVRTVATRPLPRRAVLILGLVLLWAGYVLALAVVRDTPLLTILQAGRVAWSGPLAAVVAAAWLEDTALDRVLTLLLPIAVLATGFAVWQSMTDAEVLVAAGYEYGATVRHAAGHVRAFGTLGHGLTFGHAMAVVCVTYLWRVLAGDRGLVAITGATVAGVGLVLSLTRTAIFAAVIALLVVALRRGLASGRRWRTPGVLLLVTLSAAGILALRGGAFVVGVLDGSDTSLDARAERWAELLVTQDLLVGEGPGSAGAIAQVGDDPDALGVTDNYYLAGLVQYGIPGMLCLAGLLVVLAAGFTRPALRSSWTAAAGCACLVYLLVTMTTYNVWEELPVAIPALMMAGVGLRDRAAASEDGP